MLPLALDGTLPACLTVHFQVYSQDSAKHAIEHTLKFTPSCTWWHTPSLLYYYMLCTMLARHCQVHTEYTQKFNPRHTLQDPSNCAWWVTSSLREWPLLRKFSKDFQSHSRAHSEVHSLVRPQVHTRLHSMAHSQPTWLHASKHTRTRESQLRIYCHVCFGRPYTETY